MASGGTTTSYAYNTADELCASSTGGSASCSSPNYTWDADGNMTSSPTISNLGYNSKNQTTSATFSGNTENLSYADADQTERVTAGNVTEAWSPLGLSEETTSFGTYYFVRDNQGNPIAEYHGGTNYFTTDGLGSITNVIDGATGNTDKTYTYDPFGNVTEAGSGTTTDLRYTGGFWNKASSNPGSPPLYQIGTRYYDATSGRWTQQDPIVGSIGDPGSENAYDYVGDDPINETDPSGLCAWYNIVCHAGYIEVSGKVCFGVCITGGFDIQSNGHVRPLGGVGVGWPGGGGGATLHGGVPQKGWSAVGECSAGSARVSIDQRWNLGVGAGTYESSPTCGLSAVYTGG
jgi:RHS repeat-associated protein